MKKRKKIVAICADGKVPSEEFEHTAPAPAPAPHGDEYVNGNGHTLGSSVVADTVVEAVPSDATTRGVGETSALAPGSIAATSDLILKSFAANLENILDFANEKLDDDVAALSNEINDATLYANHCTQQTHAKVKAFKQQLCASIGVFGLLEHPQSCDVDGSATCR